MTKEQEAQQAQTIAGIKARQLMRIGSQANAFGRLTAETRDCKLLLEIVDSQAQKIAEQANEIVCYVNSSHIAHDTIAEQAREIETARSLAGIATKRFFEAKENAEKYRNAYVDANARRDGHHPKSMLHGHLLPWERWDAETKSATDLTETTDSKEAP